MYADIFQKKTLLKKKRVIFFFPYDGSVLPSSKCTLLYSMLQVHVAGPCSTFYADYFSV